jgi:hypothetical protein
MVYHKYKLVFPCIPKTASTTLHNILRSDIDGGRHGGHQHYTMTDIIKSYGNSVLSGYTSFCVVRNPYDRLWSAWKHLKLKEQTKAEDDMIERFREFIKNELSHDFGKYIHYKPQVDFMYALRKYCIVDKILRFETLEQDWSEFREWYTLHSSIDTQLPSRLDPSNATVSIEEDPYDDASRSIVRSLYKDDFKILKYND